MRFSARFPELRTALTGLDPGLVRLRLAGTATAAMVLAAAVTTVLRLPAGFPVTVVLLASVLAMVSNLAVNEPELRARRVTTSLMLGPAVLAVVGGTLLAPHRVVADVVFVAVMVGAVYVRRFGPRGVALGMSAVMPFFFTQFLGAAPAQLPWLVLAAAVGIGSTLLLRDVVFAERPERALERLLRAFRAHVHALVDAVADLLKAAPSDVEDEWEAVLRRRTRLNETALLVADALETERAAADPDELALRVLDAELAAERLALTAQRLAAAPGGAGAGGMDDDRRRALLAALRALSAASATGTPRGFVTVLLETARRSVAALTAEPEGRAARVHRVAFAVVRLADALEIAREPERGSAPEAETGTGRGKDAEDAEGAEDDEPSGLRITTRQAVQVGVATSLAIVVGELVSPARWYWAVIAAFIVFAGTSSRGDVLSRGYERVIGTIGGVLAGMGLAVLVGDHPVVVLVLLFCCVFLALYLVRVSQTLMAFWLTAVLALLYGLIGQFDPTTFVVRVEETAVGVAMGILAGYLVLPKRTREAFEEALDEQVDAVHAVLQAAVEKIVGRAPEAPPVELARDAGDALGTLRQRAKPLERAFLRRRGRTGYERALRVLTGVDHYARGFARVSDAVVEPGWAATLEPAAQRVRANLDGLRAVLLRREEPGAAVRSAEDAIDAAESYASQGRDARRRAELLGAIRLLRRIDQAVVGFATDLTASEQERAADPVPPR
ncbi:FUSC family protein [Pseudonocardia kunmingensis]|uniref:Fusaric acid resistance family protein n=1 Tax=Pseudonocardia kunmingensis TaxID=630975 RepID=A0A543DR08_9PSEU|nr:FUSC family protein [Pseudonocardia kunmingensis]TQM11758.1 fusaric acid resistance family protein [Pseudonocardia kunmingensis]